MSSVLDRIRNTLKSLEDGDVKMEGTYYGQCTEEKLDLWNYFVFNRLRTTKNNASKMDYQTFYQVHIVHEDYIPEGYVEAVIAKLCEQAESGTKLRSTNDDVTYDYIFKGGTRMVVEIAHITLYHPEKRT